MAAPLTPECAHAIDAPFADFDTWFDALTFGVCTSCGGEAYAGRTGWWHETALVCPDLKKRTPRFSEDPDDD
ncbi:MAG: hypothetical protein HOY79_17990 [Streptomyces sp.]|nr:hypothetical protein [Streptomyces sp.]